MTQKIAAARLRARIVRSVLFPPIEDLQPGPVCDRRELWELLKVYFGAVTIVSALIAAAAFLFQQVSVRQEYEWRRLKEAQDILKDWDVRAGPFKFAIEAYYCERHNWSRMQPISREDALALSDRRATPELLQVRTNVVALLNYFELISTAALRRIADEPILRESLATQMVAWRGYLKEFTDLTDREVGEPAWGPYYTIADRWKKDPAAQPQVTAPPKRPSHDWGTMDRR